MNLAIKSIYTRPSIEVPFYVQLEEFKEYKNKNYMEPGHILFQQVSFSDDKLTQISFAVFANRESRILCLSDDRIREDVSNRVKHNQINNITTTRIYMLE